MVKNLSVFLLTIFTLLCGYIEVTATPVDVSVTMNSVSRTMTLIEKVSGNPVDVGVPATYLYNFTAEPGDYILTGYNASGTQTGTMEISVFEDGEMLDGGGQYGKVFKVTTITAYASNSGWTLGTDYDIECLATSREGISRVITTTTGSVTAGRKTFLMQIGDTYTLNFTMNPTDKTAGYLSTFNNAGTVTAASANSATSIPQKTVYSVSVPQESSLYVGGKRGAINQSTGGTHYVAFTEVFSDSVKAEGNSKRFYYTVGIGCWYNFRVSQTGKLTNGGKFQVPVSDGSLTITDADMNAADPKMTDHDVTHNDGSNVADILLNINARGHLNMMQGGKYQLVKHRSWQLIDTQTNNYFIDPDYHYRIVDLNGNDISNVIQINEKDEIEAVGNGTAIVLITYDAIQLKSWAQNGTPTNYFFGPLFGAIWPENTGAFVVTVGGTGDGGIVSNMKIQEKSRLGNSDGPSADVDSEHDVFYYLEGQTGYEYTFKPEGVASVSLANPVLGTNSASYNGFQNVAVNGDGTYTLLLTHGRNIVKLTSAGGTSVYQIITAKPAGYVISNKSRPDEPILPGDDVYVQYHGLFHPANKLSGIYNMSAYIVYNSIPNGNSLILSPNQYQFGGKPSAQLAQYHVPANTTGAYELRDGAIQVNGFGSAIGKHRDISIIGGINPNFTAVVRVTYFGSIPDIDIPLATPEDGFKFVGLPEDAEIIVINDVNDTIHANANGEYMGTYRTYSYQIYADGYKAVTGTNTIAAGDGLKEIPVIMELPANEWDGTSMMKPRQVTAAESTVTGSEFENKEGYYKITNAYELRWIAYQCEQKKATHNVILMNDISLNDKSWSPIGSQNAVGYKYGGNFEGNHKTISGLLIDGTNRALLGYVDGATIKDLTIEGVVSNGKAALIGVLSGAFHIENCHNKANVTGGQGTGGLIGQITAATGEAVIRNCSNSGNVNVGSNMYGGGFAGQIGAAVLIENCRNTGNVTSTSTSGYIGGFSGSMTVAATVKNCYNTGNLSVRGGNHIGGMIGYATNGSIINCYNTGIINNTHATYISGAIKGSGTAATVSNCYVSDNIGSNVAADASTTVKPETAFASGEVTWLLGSAFGQQIGTDNLPVLNGAMVYRVNYTNNLDAETATIYTNGTLPEIIEQGHVSTWKTEQYGEVINTVSSDSDLYLLFTFDVGTKLSTDSEAAINVYPNPFTDYIFVNVNEKSIIGIYDLSGQRVLSQIATQGNNRVDTSGLASGIYFVKCGSKRIKMEKVR